MSFTLIGKDANIQILSKMRYVDRVWGNDRFGYTPFRTEFSHFHEK
jgi:hypothetical protein